jgi:hypothetical protein
LAWPLATALSHSNPKGNNIMFTIVITTWLTTLAAGMFGMAAGD